jgi:large subunit ribosomal protein L17
MRHHNANRKLGRVRKVRKALLNSLALSLILKNKIKTTEAKARELRPFVEKMITLGKKATLASQRSLISKVGQNGAKKVMTELSNKFTDRKGGYTRITKLPRRSGDASLMAYIEFV